MRIGVDSPMNIIRGNTTGKFVTIIHHITIITQPVHRTQCIPFAECVIMSVMKIVMYFHHEAKTSLVSKITGVRDIAEKAKWHLQVISKIPDRKQFLALVEFWKPIGCIVECGGYSGKVKAEVFSGLPTVFFDCDPSALPQNAICVYHDSEATGKMAAGELMLAGYTDFAFVHPVEPKFWSYYREDGFAKALKINSLNYKSFVFTNKEGIVPDESGSAPIEYQRQLRTFLSTLHTPCAIFAANDSTAAEVLTAIQSINTLYDNPLDKPKFSVLGVDNFIRICENTKPKLSSIKPDFRGGGSTAALMLLALIRSKGNFVGERKRTFGPMRVVRRASTNYVDIRDPQVIAALDLISAEACLGLTAAKVISRFTCSRDMAEIRFRKATGKSILEAIHDVRLERAKELLRNQSIQLKVISDFCGFKNPNSMRKFFLSKTGQTMSAWRHHPTI